MAGFKWDQFGGLRPVATVLRLAPNEAVTADNVDLQRGVIRPRPTQQAWNSELHPSVLLAAPFTDNPASLFRFVDRSTADQYWIYWTTDVDVAPGPVENAEQRHYYTGDGAPKLFTKDSITDTTPPYPEPADTKFPKTWYLLGVPAPVAAPTIDGDSYVPPDTAKTGSITALEVDNLVLRYHPKVPHRAADRAHAFANGESNAMSGETHLDSSGGAQRMEVMLVGTRVKVTEIVDTNTVKVSGTYGNGHLDEFARNYDDPVPDNRMDDRWEWDHDELTVGALERPKLYYRINGKENDICWTYHVPDGALLTVPLHSLKVGDVIRVTSVSEAMHWDSATRLLAGAPNHQANGRLRPLTDPGEPTIEFAGDLTYFVERDGREFDPTIEDVVVDSREPTTRAYVYTYVTALGEEGPPSPPTDPFTIALGDSVSIEGFTAPPTEHRNITMFRLYRTNTGSQETAFQFVADIPIASTDYEDALADDELGEVLQSETWEPPPAEMLGICVMPNGFLAGFFDNVLCFSEPGFPHAWPVEYRMPLDQKIVAIKVISGSLIVATRGIPYIVSGTHPRQMAGRKAEEPAPCVDKRSMVDCGEFAIYASTDGLIAASVNSFRNITMEYYSQDGWRAVVGAVDATGRSVRAWHIDGEYLLFTSFTPTEIESFSSSALVFDFRDTSKLLITGAGISEPRAAFSDPVSGELYYVLSANAALDILYEDGPLTGEFLPIMRWRYLYPLLEPAPPFDQDGRSICFYRSGILMLPRPMAISVVQVICRRTSDGTTNTNFGFVRLSMSGFRYDSASTPDINEETAHGNELCFVELINGNVDAVDWPGEQRSKPFRISANYLVDALSIDLQLRGKVEVEAVLVGECFGDLLMAWGR